MNVFMKKMRSTLSEITKVAILGMFTAILAFVAIGGGSLLFLRANVMHEKQKIITAEIASKFNCYVERHFSLIANISQQYSLRKFIESDFNHKKQEKVLELFNFVGCVHDVTEVFILNEDGVIVAGTDCEVGKKVIGANYDFRAYFKSALSGVRSVYGTVDGVTGKKNIFFSLPLHKPDNSIGGVIVAKTEAKVLGTISSTVKSPILIITDDGTVFYSNREGLSYGDLKIAGEGLFGINFFRMLANIRIYERDISPFSSVVKHEGKKYLLNKEDIPLAGWQVVTLWDAKNKYPFYNIDLKSIFVMLALFVLVMALFIINFMNNKKRKKIEIKWVESEQRYKDLTETLPQSVFETDSSWQLVYANKTTFDTFGISSELSEKKVSIVSLISENNRDKITTALEKFIRDNEQDILVIESECVKSDGAVFNGEFYIKRLFNSGCFFGIRAVVVDITHIKEVERELKKTLSEKEFLLKEIHHRVKNNLQIISSLLHLQAQKMKEPDAVNAINESRSRIKTMALIHQQLYQSAISPQKINTGEYIKTLATNLAHTYSSNATNIAIDYKIESINLTIDKAVSCGLIINELISNALKYAFVGKKNGLVQIEFKEVDNKTILTVCDDGIGFPDNYDLRQSATLGIKLVQTLTEQLGGSVEFKSENGVRCVITF